MIHSYKLDNDRYIGQTKPALFNPILHGLFEIPYYMGGSNQSPTTKLTEDAKNGLGFMFKLPKYVESI